MAGEPGFEDKIAAQCGGSFTAPSLPPPRPKSPPEYPDLYGKRREMAKVQMLEREIGFLEEELKSVERLPPASRFCKEVTDFVVANSDPLTPANQKKRKSRRFLRWLCGIPCFNLSKICCRCYYCCCCSGRSDSEKPTKWCSCIGCPKPSCQCCSCSCSCPKLECCTLPTCSCNCCKCGIQKPSCDCCRIPSCKWSSCCSNWKCWVPKCREVCCCSNCTKTCC